MKKKLLPLIMIFVIMISMIIAVLYAAVFVGKIPIDLPFMKAEAIEYLPEAGLDIAKQWENVIIYEPKKVMEDITEIIDNTEAEEKTEADMIKQFSLVDTNTLKEYIAVNEDVLKNGYEKIFIDKVDLNNTPTGIKSIYGDDVLAIDMLNGITIIGINISYGDGKIAKAKLAVVDNKEQLEYSVVEDLKYWDPIETHVKHEQAILGINANGYAWNSNGKWATMYGLSKRHGDLIRKADKHDSAICFDKSGLMTIGTNIEQAWNAVEYSPVLIKQGERVYSEEDNAEAGIRMAQTAIGQTGDGKTLLLAVSGGIYGSDDGAVFSEVLDIMEKYKAVNASMLAGGSRTVMFWNNRVVTNHSGYREEGVLLPTALVIKPMGSVVISSDTTDKQEDTNVNVNVNKISDQYIPDVDDTLNNSETNTENGNNESSATN